MGKELFSKNRPYMEKALKGEKIEFETILIKHNGKISVESKEGKGSNFYVSLPKNSIK